MAKAKKARDKGKKLLTEPGQPKEEKKAVKIPLHERTPTCPEYLHMKKKDVLIAEEKRREKEKKTKAYRAGLDKEDKENKE